MRTEDQLRNALTPEPDESRRAERLTEAILARTAEPARRRRPALVLVAAALVLVVVVAGFALSNRPRQAAPVETPTPALPTAARTEGNWRMVHRVDVPPGWRVVGRHVTARDESTDLVATDGTADCSVEVWGPGPGQPTLGTPTPPGEPGPDATVHGRPAYWDGYRTLVWSYRDDAVAQVTCVAGGLEAARTIADRVVFAPTVLRVPLRLLQVPDGYQVGSLTDGTDEDRLSASYFLSPEGTASRPELTIAVHAGESDLLGVESGVERGTVAGYPALLQASDSTLDLDAGDFVISLQFFEDRLSDRWRPGRREQLVALAESLEVAPDLGDRSTWFDAQDAVPN